MKIGILSETHGHVERTRLAMLTLIDQTVRTVIHCGDIGSESVLAEIYECLEPEGIPFFAVLGNVDYPDDAFDSWSKTGEFEIMGRFGKIDLDGKLIAVIHGDDFRRLWAAEINGRYDYILTGHTHKKDDHMTGATRIINPGAVYRASELSVATLDIGTGQLEFIPL